MWIIVILVFFIIIGMPLAFALGMPFLTYVTLTDTFIMSIIPQRMFSALDSFPLLAVPLFIFAGGIMGRTTMAEELIDFVSSLVGWLRGGLAQVNIATSMFFGGISGASASDIAAFGPVMIPQMKRKGYDAGFSAAVTSSSATLGIIIPPSIPMILYAVISGTSVSRMFIAGIIPAILITIALSAVSFVISAKRGYPKEAFPALKHTLKMFVRTAPVLVIPFIIIGGIILGIVTPTEAAVLAVLVAAFLGIFYKLRLKDYIELMYESALTTSVLCLLVATASLFSWLLAHLRIPENIAMALLSISDNPYVIVFFIIIVLIILGTVLVSGPAIILTVPLFLPIIKGIGMDPVHFGMILIVALGIGQQTPPIGTALFNTSAISGLPIEQVSYSVMPFVFSMVAILFLIAYIPIISLWLPNLLL